MLMLLNRLLVIISCSTVVFGCNPKPATTDVEQEQEVASPLTVPTPDNKVIQLVIDKWGDMSENSGQLSALYAPNAIKILTDGTVLSHREPILDYWQGQRVVLTNTKVDTLILAHAERAITYGVLQYDLGYKIYQSLVIFQEQEGEIVRVFEYDQVVDEMPDVETEIAQRRDEWMTLCNSHDVAALVQEMYSENTLYYNHKPLIIGRENLVAEYSYMARPSYSLELRPLYFAPVNSKFVFEIGQCSGGYGGKYILIWRKDEDGKWRVYIDANI